MARRIHLHIGLMKSATSYLQALCELNADRLAAGGLLWCPSDLRYQPIRDLLGREPSGPRVNWSMLADLLHRHDGDALLSNELLAALGARQAGRLVAALPADEVRVVITARDPARVVPSHWQTTIKNGKTWSWSQFAASVCGDGADATHEWFWRRHDLAGVVRRWAKVVPVERITLVTVPDLTDGASDVSARFGAAIGVDLRGLEQPAEPRNPSLGAHSVELLRRLNTSTDLAQTIDSEHRYERALGGALARHADLEPRFSLPWDQHDWLRRRAEAMVADVAGLGLAVKGDLAELVPSHKASSDSVDPSETTDAELLAAALWGLAGLAEWSLEQHTEVASLRTKLHLAQNDAG